MSGLRRLLGRLFGSAPRSAPERMPECLVVGLGNPGSKYADMRHNVGFRVVERLAERRDASWRRDAALDALVAEVEIAGRRCLMVEPQTFMNRSGRTVAAACARWAHLDPETDLLVVYDDMDLPTGRLRLRPSGGAAGHRGMGDVLDALDTRAVGRLRFGVGHPGEHGGAAVDWVLAPFAAEDLAPLAKAIDRAVDAIEKVLAEGVPAAMGQFNALG